jgi:hypothetical protein
MPGLSDEVLRFQRSIRQTLWLRSACRTGVVALWISGCVIVSSRILWQVPTLYVSTVLLSLVVTTVIAAWIARRNTPSLATLRAEIDRANHAHGRLIAEAELPINARRRLQLDSIKIERPRITWRSQQTLGLAAPAILFVLATLLIPDSWLVGEDPNNQRLDVSERISNLETQLETLEDLQILPENESESIQADLERVEEDAEGRDPGKTLESLEHIADRLERIAEDEAAELTEAANQSSELAAAADALDQAADELSPESLEAALAELAEMAEESSGACEGISPKLQKILDSIAQNGLSSEELGQLAEAFSQCNGLSQDMLKQLANSGLLDPSALQQAAQCLSPEDIKMLSELLSQCEGQISEEGLEAILAAGFAECDSGELAALIGSGQPGQGGISRGRGDAHLAYSGETDEHGATFTNEVLGSSALNPDGTTTIQSTTRGSGESEEQTASSTGGGLTGQAGGGGAHARAILPHHRGAVRNYFGQD